VAFPHARQDRDADALATGTWQRGDATGKQDFKLLVPADSRFFQTGYVYCLFLLEHKVIVDDASVAKALDALGAARARCATNDAACADRGIPRVSKTEQSGQETHGSPRLG